MYVSRDSIAVSLGDLQGAWRCLFQLNACVDAPGHEELTKHAVVLKPEGVDHRVVIIRHRWVDPFQSLHSKLCPRPSQRNIKGCSCRQAQVINLLLLPLNSTHAGQISTAQSMIAQSNCSSLKLIHIAAILRDKVDLMIVSKIQVVTDLH
jgi:hypothetical protein